MITRVAQPTNDVVGYAPFPNEIIELVRKETSEQSWATTIKGQGLTWRTVDTRTGSLRKRRLGDISFQWTRERVTPENKAFWGTFQKQIRFEADGKRFHLVHGSPQRISEYLFEDRPLSSFQHIAKDAEADVIVCGHTHKPYTKEVDEVLFVNDGSAGKPKDRIQELAMPSWNCLAD